MPAAELHIRAVLTGRIAWLVWPWPPLLAVLGAQRLVHISVLKRRIRD